VKKIINNNIQLEISEIRELGYVLEHIIIHIYFLIIVGHIWEIKHQTSEVLKQVSIIKIAGILDLELAVHPKTDHKFQF